MSVVAVTSSRTSPGATTLAAGLSIVWSQLVEQALLIEADPAGGVLALRFDLAPAPSLTSFGSDISNGFDREALWANTQDLRGVRCMPAPVDPMLARSWVDRVTPDLITELPRLGAPTIIDLGWVDQDGASANLASAADTTLVVTRPDTAEIQALLFQVRRLQNLDTNIAIVCIGNGPNDPAEIARIAGVPLAAVLPDDPKIAAALSGAKHTSGKFKRSLFWRSISGLGASLFNEALLQSRAVGYDAPASAAGYSGFSDTRGTLDELAPAALASNEPLPRAPRELQRPQAHAPVAAPAPTAAIPPPPSAASIAAALAPIGQTPPPAAASIAAALAPTDHTPPPATASIAAALAPTDHTPPPAAASIIAALAPIRQTRTAGPDATPQSIARALASAAEMAQILAEAPTSAPQPQSCSGPATPVPSPATPSPATVISLTRGPTAAPSEVVDPGLFEDTRRMLDRMPAAKLTLPTGECKTISPGSTVSIGRHSTCDIILHDSQVSRHHGRLIHTTDGWHYSDLGSRNGSEINGQVCTDAVLATRDVLTLGQTPVIFDTTARREMECA